jgi:hypothetical protein
MRHYIGIKLIMSGGTILKRIRKVTLELPVMHVSFFYEAFAYSEWKVAAYLLNLSGK